MSDFRRKLFEWLDPDWLEEAGRFPVPGHGGAHRDHDGGDRDDHGDGDGGDRDLDDGDRVEDDKKVDEVNYLHCALRCGWLGGKPQSADRLSYCSLAGSTFRLELIYFVYV